MIQTNLSAQRIRIMGVINVTPDSFSDGGQFLDPQAALQHADQLIADGADYLDVGAESTRPGAASVDASEEWRRLEPVLRGLAEKNTHVSVDTRKAEIMLRAANLGAAMINDVNGVADDTTLRGLATEYPGIRYCAMHKHGDPGTMQAEPLDGQAAVRAVDDFFQSSHTRLLAAGFSRSQIWLDPGIGFGKSDAGNAQVMAAIPRWAERYQIAVGVSRKSLLGRLLDIPEAADRDAASKMLEMGLIAAGASMVRTHDVATLKRITTLFASDKTDED